MNGNEKETVAPGYVQGYADGQAKACEAFERSIKQLQSIWEASRKQADHNRDTTIKETERKCYNVGVEAAFKAAQAAYEQGKLDYAQNLYRPEQYDSRGSAAHVEALQRFYNQGYKAARRGEEIRRFREAPAVKADLGSLKAEAFSVKNTGPHTYEINGPPGSFSVRRSPQVGLQDAPLCGCPACTYEGTTPGGGSAGPGGGDAGGTERGP